MNGIDSISSNQVNSSGGSDSTSTQNSWDQYDATFRNMMFKQLQEELKSLDQQHKENEKRNKEILQGS